MFRLKSYANSVRLEIQTVQFARLLLELLERWRLDHVAVHTEIPGALHVVFVTEVLRMQTGTPFSWSPSTHHPSPPKNRKRAPALQPAPSIRFIQFNIVLSRRSCAADPVLEG